MTGQHFLRVSVLLAALAAASLAGAQDVPVISGVIAVPGSEVPTFIINLRDADLRALAEQVSEITGRTLILDAAVAGNVTVISATPLDKDGVWDLFQSVLAVQGFAAVPSGNLWRVVTQQAAKESGGGGSALEATTRLDVITRLVPLENFPASTAVAALRPLVAASGYLEAVPETNTLVITDTAENVGRIENIARSLDLGSGKQIYTLAIRNGDASEIAMAVQNILSQKAGTAGARVTVDPRSNVLIFNGDEKTYEMVRGLVSGGTMVSNPVADALQAEPVVLDETGQPVTAGLAPPPLASFASEDITIQPVIESNSVVVRARAEVLADNGGTIVLGGLITDDRQSTRAMVPGLGNLPIIGGLFRSRNESARRQTLFIFLRPTILRSRGDVAAAANDSFLRLKSIEADTTGERGSILDEPRPVRNLPVEIDGLY